MMMIMTVLMIMTTTTSSYHSNKKLSSYLKILDCEGPLKPRVVQSTEFSSSYPASSLLIWAEKDAVMANGKHNYWLAEKGKTTGQGFTIQVDGRYSYLPICKRMIAGIQIKNTRNTVNGENPRNDWATEEFQVSGS